VGAGGLGAPAAAHLAAAGVGTIGIVDPDVVELSNLHRQLLHGVADLNRPKVASARAALRAIAPDLRVEAIQARVDADSAPRLFSRYDVIVDAVDGSTIKYVVNDAAVALGRPLVHAGVLGFVGQVLVVAPGRSACLRCVFPTPPPPGTLPLCREAGIFGPVAGVIGTLQAAQAIACLVHDVDPAIDQLITYDGLRTRWRTVRVRRRPQCPACHTVRTAAGDWEGVVA
jgi:adenylyltransferase/sulfurtransferase